MASEPTVPPQGRDPRGSGTDVAVRAPPEDGGNAALVSVVVPAYNAERWIDATLRSLRSQTYGNVEIIVVDDGSQDRTTDIIDEHRARDPRVSMIRQANAGVAAARNRGIAAARGPYIAPTDADDLSAPTRIAELVAALELAGPDTGVAYSWSSFIDEDGFTIGTPPRPEFAGDVRHAMYANNFVANGSAALMRADALRGVGGYDSTLRERKAQGCEDWAVLLQLAEYHRFVAVPEFLLGYRQSPTNMSSDRSQMWRSFNLVAARHAKRFPLSRKPLQAARKTVLATALQQAVDRRGHASVARLAALMTLRSPRWAYNILASSISRTSHPAEPEYSSFDMAEGAATRQRFAIADPDCA